MRACVLGGSGFIGQNLRIGMVTRGWDVTSFGRGAAPTAAGFNHVTGEFEDHDAVARAVEGSDVVFHLIGAGNPALAEVDRIADMRRSLENTVRLFDAGARGAYGRLVFLSSGGTVYGVPKSIPIREEADQWPTSTYGVHKMAIERYAHLYEHLYGVPHFMARVSNPFGPYQLARHGQGVIAVLLRCAMRSEPFNLIGDGSSVRDYLFIGDVVDALDRLARYEGHHRVFNIGSGEGHSLSDLIAIVEQETSHAITINPMPPRAIDVPTNVLDVSLAAEQIGWRANTSLREGLRRTFAWLGSHDHPDDSRTLTNG